MTADGTALEGHVEQGVEWLRQQVGGLLEGERGIRVDVATLTPDYMLSFAPDAIVRHILRHRDNYQLLRQKSLITADDGDDCWSLLLMAADRPGLLAKICGVMVLNNLAVIRAQIFTDSGSRALIMSTMRLSVSPVSTISSTMMTGFPFKGISTSFVSLT